MPDVVLKCKQCGQTFIYENGEQAFFAKKNLDPPERCKPCRAKNRTTKDQTLICKVCGDSFVFTADEQKYARTYKWVWPERCYNCRELHDKVKYLWKGRELRTPEQEFEYQFQEAQKQFPEVSTPDDFFKKAEALYFKEPTMSIKDFVGRFKDLDDDSLLPSIMSELSNIVIETIWRASSAILGRREETLELYSSNGQTLKYDILQNHLLVLEGKRIVEFTSPVGGSEDIIKMIRYHPLEIKNSSNKH